MPRLVAPGSCALASMTSLWRSSPLGRHLRASSTWPPAFQYLATVCRCMP